MTNRLLTSFLLLCGVLSAGAEDAPWVYLRTGIGSKQGLNGATWSTNGARSGDIAAANLPNYRGMIRKGIEGQTLSSGSGETFAGQLLQVGQIGDATTDVGSLRFYNTLTVSQLILANGALKNHYGTTYSVVGPVSVISPATAPFKLTDGSYRPGGSLILNGPISSPDASVALLVRGTTNDFSATFAGDASGYTGRVRVESATHPDTGAPFGSTFRINESLAFGGSVEVGSGATFEVRSGVSIAGNVSLETGSTFDFAGAVTVGSLTLEEGVGLAFTAGARLTVTNELVLQGVIPLTVPGAPTEPPAEVVTRALIDFPIDAEVSPDDFSLPSAAAPNLTGYLTFVTNQEQTVKTLSLSYYPEVSLLVKDSTSWSTTDLASSVVNASAWSDQSLPHDKAHYVVNALHLVLPPTSGAFAGTTLTLKGSSTGLTVQSPDYRIDRLITESGSDIKKGIRIQCKQGATDLKLDGAIEIRSRQLDIVGRASSVLTVASAICGDETTTCRFGGATGATGAFRSTFVLTGDNTGFLGAFQIMANPFYWQEIKPGIDENFATVRVSSGAALGGALAAFNYQALTIGEGGMLQADASVTLDAANRGVFLSGPGAKVYVDSKEKPLTGLKSARFNVPEAAHTLAIKEQITVTNYAGGVIITKEGAGTLALGGALRYLNADGAIQDVPSTDATYELRVTDGSIEALADEAFNGLDIVFAPATDKTVGLKVPAKTDGLGLVNVRAQTPFAKAASLATVPITIEPPAADLGPSATVPLVTVPAGADVSFLSLPRRITLGTREYCVRRVTEDVTVGGVAATKHSALLIPQPGLLFMVR